MRKPKKSIKNRGMMHPDDYWMLIKEEGDFLWYLSKTKAITKRKIIDRKKCTTVYQRLSPFEIKQFDIEQLWDEKFGAYERKYGKHRGRNGQNGRW